MYQKALSNSDIAGKIVMLLLSLLAKGNLRIFRYVYCLFKSVISCTIDSHYLKH